MIHEDPDQLTPEERDALDSLPRHMAPPAWLEQRIVDELRTGKQIRGARPAHRWVAAAGAVAASLVLFAAGLSAGRYMERTPAPTASGSRFMLLLYEDSGYINPESGGPASRVAEYSAWARELNADGRFVGGEKLKDAAETLTATEQAAPGTTGLGMLAGYFIIAASDQPEALAIARRCPHLRYGGRIVVREIDPT